MFNVLRTFGIWYQAHVRGYQVRKNYKVICWAVGVLDKVVLRWRRKGVGLRGFRSESDCIDDEEEDILKVFRKQKVDVAIDEAVSRVLSMVDSPDARQQYRRMLEKYRQAKVSKPILSPNHLLLEFFILVIRSSHKRFKTGLKVDFRFLI